MKHLLLVLTVLTNLFLTSCSRPYIPDFCARPDHIFIDDQHCYDSNQGLIIHASPVSGADTSIRLNWTVYVLKDSLQQAPYTNPYLAQASNGYSVVVSDSVLKDNGKVYVEVRTTCAGIPAKKAVGINGNIFVRRYNKVGGCYYWVDQP